MNIKILLVGDNQVIHSFKEMITNNLPVAFFVDIDMVDNRKEATELACRKVYDIIFIDVQLPGMDDFDTFIEIRNEVNKHDPLIIFITTHDPKVDNFFKAMDVNGVDYLTKPVNPKELGRMLRLYLKSVQWKKEVLEHRKKINNNLDKEVERRKKVEAELLKMKENFSNIVGNSNTAILIVDYEGTVRFVNPSGEKIFLRKACDMIGKKFGIILNNKKSEIDIIRKDGTVGTGEIEATRTLWEDKPAWLVMITDITEHKRLCKCLEQAKEKAQESDKLKSAFLSNMSHEIRTPMNGIIGFLNLLKDRTAYQEKWDIYIKSIETCGYQLLQIINDIIDISKIEANQINISIGEYAINNILIVIHEFYSLNKEICARNINLRLEVPKNSNEIKIWTDPVRIRQIFENLIRNAIKFTTSGYIKLGYSIDDENDRLVFFVQDTGIGIPIEKQNIIFDRFVQATSLDATFTEGTGLGLSITKSLVELLGGEIWLKSEKGSGSTFYFTLPMAKSKPGVTKKNVTKASQSKKKPNTKKILVVEDVDMNFNLISDLLLDNKIRNIELIWCKNGLEAINQCKKNNIDLILMDIKMPVLNGFEATRQIREFNVDVPIIAQTAYAMQYEKQECLEVGCNDYITKPYLKDMFLNIVNKYL